MWRRKMCNALPLLDLPTELLQIVLGMLKPVGMLALLRVSKAMAKQVMQCSSGRLRLRVEVGKDWNWARTRQLLLWAPPACITLHVWSATRPCYWGSQTARLSMEALQGLFSTTPGSQEPLRSLLHIHLEKMALPSLMLPSLATLCPMLQSLHLDTCVFQLWGGCGSRAGLRAGSEQTAAVEVNIHTLKLTDAGLLMDMLPAASVHSSRAAHFAKQLTYMLSTVQCLHLYGTRPSVDILHVQLQELQGDDNSLPWHTALSANRFVQLRKLVLPDCTIEGAAELQLLLELPCVTHVDLQLIIHIRKDLSKHACSWQHLWLRGYQLQLCDLAYVPLHSLTTPLLIGEQPHSAKVYIYTNRAASRLQSLQHMCEQLLRCGVEAPYSRLECLADDRKDVNGSDDDSDDDGVDDAAAAAAGSHSDTEARHAAVLAVLSPLIQAMKAAELDGWTIGLEAAHALGRTSQHRLATLELSGCDLRFETQAVAKTLLESLPVVTRVEISFCWKDLFGHRLIKALAIACEGFMLAMKSEQTCRQIKICVYDDRCVWCQPWNVARAVRQQVAKAQVALSVQLTDKYDAHPCVHTFVLTKQPTASSRLEMFTQFVQCRLAILVQQGWDTAAPLMGL